MFIIKEMNKLYTSQKVWNLGLVTYWQFVFGLPLFTFKIIDFLTSAGFVLFML